MTEFRSHLLVKKQISLNLFLKKHTHSLLYKITGQFLGGLAWADKKDLGRGPGVQAGQGEGPGSAGLPQGPRQDKPEGLPDAVVRGDRDVPDLELHDKAGEPSGQEPRGLPQERQRHRPRQDL